jgi:hypothetical protein
MNKETQQFWITDGGEWGSNMPDTVEFIGHHDDIHEAFDMVSDWELQSWAAWLSQRPHIRANNASGSCAVCEDLADQFGMM